MVRHCAVWYGMVWYGSVQGSIGYATVHCDMVSKIFLVEFPAKLARFGLADVNFYVLSMSFKVQCPLNVGGEGLNLGVAWNPNTLNFYHHISSGGGGKGEGAGATPLLIPRFPLTILYVPDLCFFEERKVLKSTHFLLSPSIHAYRHQYKRWWAQHFFKNRVISVFRIN